MNLTFEPVKGIRYEYEYGDVQRELEKCFKAEDEGGVFSIVRDMVEADLWFLLFFVLGIGAVNRKWITERIYEVQADHNGTMDLWPRGHWKSTIISYGLNIWKILKNPEERIGILSYIRAISKANLRRIKTTFETNEYLKGAFDHVLYENPKVQSPKWTEDEGIIVQRKGVYADSTVEAWGLTDSMPTGKHFTHLCIDDAEERGVVASPEMVRKTILALSEADNLLDVEKGTKCMLGTFWSHAGPYANILKSKVYKERIWGPFWTREAEDSLDYDQLVVYTKEKYIEKRNRTDDYTFSCQISNRPSPSSEIKFKMEWIKYWRGDKPYCNVYIVVDPAKGKEAKSDYTTIIVYGVNAYRNFLILDMVRDKLGLREKWEALRDRVYSWQPLDTGYEEFAMQADIEYIQEKQELEGISFNINPLKGAGKNERIKNLISYFKEGRILWPHSLTYTNLEGRTVDLVSDFIDEEYTKWPFGDHDDILDALSRMMDSKMGIIFPNVKSSEWGNPLASNKTGSWMSA